MILARMPDGPVTLLPARPARSPAPTTRTLISSLGVLHFTAGRFSAGTQIAHIDADEMQVGKRRYQFLRFNNHLQGTRMILFFADVTERANILERFIEAFLDRIGEQTFGRKLDRRARRFSFHARELRTCRRQSTQNRRSCRTRWKRTKTLYTGRRHATRRLPVDKVSSLILLPMAFFSSARTASLSNRD